MTQSWELRWTRHVCRYSLPSPSVWLLFQCFPGFPVFVVIPLWLNLPSPSTLSEASLQIPGFQILPKMLHVFH